MISRMKIYLHEMYPVPQRLLASFLMTSGFLALLSGLCVRPFRLDSLEVIIGTMAVFMLMLILRLMDELKDLEIDKTLFAHRPVPSGRVYEKDIHISLIVLCLGFILIHTYRAEVLISAILLLGYCGLMYKYFFIPNILRRYLLLNLATHNPVIALVFGHITVIFLSGSDNGSAADPVLILPLILSFWASLFAWEIARKIRSPREEDAYVTYSQIFGRTGAVAIAAFAQLAALVLFLIIIFRLGLPIMAGLPMIVAFPGLVLGYLRFLKYPVPRNADLKMQAEGYILVMGVNSLITVLIL